MSRVGFDGRVRPEGPYWGRWLLSSFVLSVLYWFICMKFFDVNPFWQLVITNGNKLPWKELAIQIGPSLMSIAIAFPFRVPDKSVTTWLILLYGSGLATGVGLFAVIMTFGFLG